MPKGYPLEENREVPMKLLADYPLVLYRDDFNLHDDILTNCKKIGFTPKVVFETSQRELMLQTVASGIRIGPVPISLTLVPIVVGAILFGPGAGAGLGFVFGLVCLIAGVTGADKFTYLLWTASPFWLIVVCVGKAVLCGLCAGLAAKALEKKQTLSCIAAALVAPVVNTGVFAVGMLTVFRPILAQYAGGTDVVTYLFVAFIGVNFLVEFAVNAVLSAAIARIVQVVRKQLEK